MDHPAVTAVLADWDAKVAAFDPKEDLEKRIASHANWLKTMEQRGQQVPDDRKAPPTEPVSGPIADMPPGSCYARMLTPIKGLSVKGVIWSRSCASRPQPPVVQAARWEPAWTEALWPPPASWRHWPACGSG